MELTNQKAINAKKEMTNILKTTGVQAQIDFVKNLKEEKSRIESDIESLSQGRKTVELLRQISQKKQELEMINQVIKSESEEKKRVISDNKKAIQEKWNEVGCSPKGVEETVKKNFNDIKTHLSEIERIMQGNEAFLNIVNKELSSVVREINRDIKIDAYETISPYLPLYGYINMHDFESGVFLIKRTIEGYID